MISCPKLTGMTKAIVTMQYQFCFNPYDQHSNFVGKTDEKLTKTTKLATILLIALLATGHKRVLAQDKIDFARDVRPILSNACFTCHGPDELTREADLRLDTSEGLFTERDGTHIVKPGEIESSELVRRIQSDDEFEVMPPPEANKSLTQKQKDILIRWIRQGADWQQHWAFIPPSLPDVPHVRNTEWSRNEIDSFILAKLEAADLQPSQQAPPLVLIRRLYLDLIGLPPTPDEADEWARKIWSDGRNENTDQYQALVDYLLSSPHYGERWARRWLDLARYADSNGYEKDRERSIWPYRDWVIEAINSDMPFDQFTIEQLAGDMIPGASVSQKVATGFHRNTMLNEEGGIDPLEFRFHAMTDRVSTTGTTWLGLTLGCCQCHSHKYDPISHTEYYQLMAFLNNADEPYLELPGDDFDKQWADNRARAKQLSDQLVTKWPVEKMEGTDSEVAEVTATQPATLTSNTNGQIQANGDNPASNTYVIELLADAADFTHISLFPNTVGKAKGPGRSEHGNFVLSEIVVEMTEDGESESELNWRKVPILSATSSVEQSGFELNKAFDGDDKTGWGLHGPNGIPKTASAHFKLDKSTTDHASQTAIRLKVTLKQLHGSQHTIGAFRIQLSNELSTTEIADRQRKDSQAQFEKWLVDERNNAVPWTTLTPTAATSNLPILTIEDDGAIFASGDTAKRDDYYIELAPSDEPIHAIRLEALPDERLPARGPGSTYYEGTIGDFYLTEFDINSSGNKHTIQSASESYAKNRYGNNPVSAALTIDGDVQTGWSVHGRQGERHIAVFILELPVPPGQPVRIHMTFGRHFASSLGRFRFSSTASTKPHQARDLPEHISQLLIRPDIDLSDAERQQLFRHFLLTTPQLADESKQIKNLLKRPSTPSTLVLRERPESQPRPTHRHHRGEYLQPKETVQANTPSVLHDFADKYPQDRMGFARWMVADDNPLTPRVVVNRHWAAFFGEGLVRTVGDFGLQGESPSHPELLDWLAVTWINEDDWSLKQLHRRIVTSATYRQSSVINDEALAVDPGNRLLSFAPRFRLDAEVLRDQLLTASGVLSKKIGGPPVRPLQPAGITEVAFGSPKWPVSKGEDRYRRSIYTFVKRTAPFAMLLTFDGPSGEACIAKRDRSNSPLQALTLLNDVMLMDLSGHAGKRMVERSTNNPEISIQDHIRFLLRSVVVRQPTEKEIHTLLTFYTRQVERFENDREAVDKLLAESPLANSANPATQAAWTATARAIFSLDETATRE